MNKSELQKRIAQGLISEKKHPSLDIYIYNYTPEVQFEDLWDEYTRACRGLILDNNMNIIGNSFPKFFNLGQSEETKIENLPAEVPQIAEKLDGSFGIFYIDCDGQYSIATRGSFTSEQAIWATKWLRNHTLRAELNKDYTYICEIIFPENTNVVQYGERSECPLIAVRETKTGKEIDYIAEAKRLGLPFANLYEFRDINAAKAFIETKKGTEFEGFVVKYSNGFRVKMKSSDYFRLHKVINQASNVAVWEQLSINGKIDSTALENIPDELYGWIKSVESDLTTQYSQIMERANQAVTEINQFITEKVKKGDFKDFNPRKEKALFIQKNFNDISGIVFALMDGKTEMANRAIWKRIRPEFKTFARCNLEDV